MNLVSSVSQTLAARRLGVMSVRRLFAVLLFIGFFGFNVQAVRDPDLWWHLQTGEYILATGTIPTADPDFAFTTAGKFWFMHEWLSEVIMALVYNGWGLYGLSILFGLVMAATHILMYLSSPGRPYLAGAVSLVAAFAVFAHTSARPHLFNLLLGALIVYLVESIKDRHLSIVWLWIIPPLMVFWVNLHSGFLFGIAILGVYVVGETAAFFLGGDSRALSRRNLQMLVIITAVTGLASLINRNGLNVWFYPFETLSSEGMRTVIAEWQAPDFHNWYRMLFALLFVGCLVLMALNRQRPTVTDLLFVLGTGLAALQSVRHISLFIILAIPIISRYLLGLFAGSRFYNQLSQNFDRLDEVKPLQNILNWVLALLAVLLLGVWSNQSLQQTDEVVAFYFPVEAVDFIKREGLTSGRVFNDYGWGGYLIWRDIQPFIDGRADLYGDEFLLTYNRVVNLKEGWQDIFNEYDIDYVLIAKDSHLAAVLREDETWQLLYTDDLAVIFARP